MRVQGELRTLFLQFLLHSSIPNLQMVVVGDENFYGDLVVDDSTSEGCESDEDFVPSSLCFLHPGLDYNFSSSDRVLRKVKELNERVRVTCDSYEDQFKALLQVSAVLLIFGG